MAEIIFYYTVKGNSEVDDFLQLLDDKAVCGDMKAEKHLEDIDYTFQRVEDGMPHSRPLRGGLYELRPGRLRILYFRWQGKLVLLTVFQKSTQ
ncbi:type II toxin-antitoxin system RelE/ParE family toxin [Paenibacillus terrae]|uniref:Type II toxin-antitoxin system RelE/ParE family toxin n=1 Tax=Paenibacillus terrae TaxID=159743 RepID=A0A0D7X2Z0_9BACL|nr:type II toxin-antitoxin system RelE/ParE family toxin [Paenibacillus terrae]KJD45624.1 hypothetical protein QD47_10635 [Paenibacillus terrae]